MKSVKLEYRPYGVDEPQIDSGNGTVIEERSGKHSDDRPASDLSQDRLGRHIERLQKKELQNGKKRLGQGESGVLGELAVFSYKIREKTPGKGRRKKTTWEREISIGGRERNNPQLFARKNGPDISHQEKGGSAKKRRI